jgi:coenzyme F420-0:L-glutamate ligase/coenzyme F420-1:gamma-L-glutamate ligase
MREQWRADLAADGFDAEQVARRLERGDVLRRAPLIVVAALVMDGAHDYPDARRRQAEREMFVASAGAGIENFLIALAAEGLASAWISSTMFCRPIVREVLGLDDGVDPMGAIAVGHAAADAPPRPPVDLTRVLLER